jgi:hypothetical protein
VDTTISGCTCPWAWYWTPGATPVCTACAAGANTTVLGATSSSQCYCPTGYYGKPAAAPGCSPCAPLGVEGTTAGPSTAITTVSSCICSKNYYVGASACVQCPVNAVTLGSGERPAVVRRHLQRGVWVLRSRAMFLAIKQAGAASRLLLCRWVTCPAQCRRYAPYHSVRLPRRLLWQGLQRGHWLRPVPLHLHALRDCRVLRRHLRRIVRLQLPGQLLLYHIWR